MAFILYRPGNLRDPYERPPEPHHVHNDTACSSPSDECPVSHWLNEGRQRVRPEKGYPHHVEIDAGTGLIAWTRLTADEITDLEQLYAFEAEMRDSGVHSA
jgi:hypothetical protein